MTREEMLAQIAEMKTMQDRLNPRISRFMERLLDNYDEDMVLNIATHIGITMLAWCLLVVEDRGVDPDDYMHAVLAGLALKHTEGRAGVQADEAITKASITSGFTCRPRH
jgi:hypothetical protein